MTELTDLTGPLGWAESWGHNQRPGGPPSGEGRRIAFEKHPDGAPGHYTGVYLDPAANKSTFDARVAQSSRGAVLSLTQDGTRDRSRPTYFASACAHLRLSRTGAPQAVGFYIDVDNNVWPWTMTKVGRQ